MMIWLAPFIHLRFDDCASLEVHEYTVNISLAASTLSEKPASLDESRPIPLDAPVTIATLGLPESASCARPLDEANPSVINVFS